MLVFIKYMNHHFFYPTICYYFTIIDLYSVVINIETFLFLE